MSEPRFLKDFEGQPSVIKMARPALLAYQAGKPMEHVCLSGPPGLGKTTFAKVLANELGTKFYVLDAKSIKKANDLIMFAMQLEDGDVLFIDEVHGIDRGIEEQIYSIFTHTFNLLGKTGYFNDFVIVGATTRPGDLSAPLRSRFTLWLQFVPYGVDFLAKIVADKADQDGFLANHDAIKAVAVRSRGAARTALSLWNLVENFALAANTRTVDAAFANHVMKEIQVDQYGLNEQDRKLLKALRDVYKEQPVGLSTMAAYLNEDQKTLEYMIEPFLLSSGYLQRTPKGRIITDLGKSVLQ